MDFKEASLDLLLKNRRTKGKFQYTVPSPQTYSYQWFWDSCFHAIILSHFNTEDAKRELLSLVSKQFEDGLIPHIIYWGKPGPIGASRITINWGKAETSSITQPPMIAYAAWRIFEKDGDLKFLETIYPHLFHYYNYLLTERDPRNNHLSGIINPDESGEDNSPRFDIPLGDLSPTHALDENFKKRLDLVEKNLVCDFEAGQCMKNFFWVKDVPFNAILVENLKLLAKIAKELDKKGDVLHFNQHQQMITKSMQSLMLEDGLFWSTHGENYKKIKIKTWAIFAPLFASIPTKEEAEQLVNEHLLNKKEFWTRFPVSTVSKDESSFDENGWWRGPTWIAINWFIFRGLMNYGFTELAEKIKQSCMRLVEKSGFREYFNPETGEGLGAKDFTWGGLVVDMMEYKKASPLA